MPTDVTQILEAARAGFATQEGELATLRVNQLCAVITKIFTGTGDVDHTFGLDRKFRLVFVRCHFSGTVGVAPLTLSVVSASGTAYDTHLFTIAKAGTNRDVNLRICADESEEPSSWTFQSGDGVRVQWTNPDSGSITWGLEVGLAIAT